MLNTASHQVHIKVIKKNGISVGTRLHFLISIPDLVVWSQNCIISHIRFTCVCFLIVHYSGARESGCRGGVYGKLISLVNSKHCCLMTCGGRGLNVFLSTWKQCLDSCTAVLISSPSYWNQGRSTPRLQRYHFIVSESSCMKSWVEYCKFKLIVQCAGAVCNKNVKYESLPPVNIL